MFLDAAGALPTIVSWRPMASMMGAGAAFVLAGNAAGTPMRVALAGGGVAAATAFLLDDPAAETLAASPTPLATRRRTRVLIAAVAVSAWWAAAVTVAAGRAGGFPILGRALELAALVAIALAVAAAASSVGDRTGGGIAGAATAIACLASTFLPARWWLPFPANASAPGAPLRLAMILLAAGALLGLASRDPAHRRVRLRRRPPRRHG